MILTEKPASWASYTRKLPDGYKVISESEAKDPKNKEILTSARSFINRNVEADKPVGHQEFHTVNGRKILYIVEPHFHEPNGKTVAGLQPGCDQVGAFRWQLVRWATAEHHFDVGSHVGELRLLGNLVAWRAGWCCDLAERSL